MGFAFPSVVTVRKRLILLAATLLCVVALWKGLEVRDERDRASGAGRTEDDYLAPATAKEGNAAPQLPGKASIRFASDPAATHPPERLNQFYLPPVNIEGLPLEAALRKLLAVYEEACRETGETPLPLTFSVPTGPDRLLKVKVGGGTLDNSIRLLASLSSLKVKREGPAYLFEEPAETGRPVKKSLGVPPDILSRLKSAAPSPPGDPADLIGALAALGVDLDPSTRLKFSAGSSILLLETLSAADEVAVTALVERFASERPIQHKLQIRVVELAAGVEWTPPEISQLDEQGMQLVMRELAQTKGVDLMTMPSTVARDGQLAKVEVLRIVVSAILYTM